MENKFFLEITEQDADIAPQGIIFPACIMCSDERFKNWYYMNYMQPIVRLDSINSLACNIADAFIYGANAYVNSKIIRVSNINIDICRQITDICDILKHKIQKKYYCILFLDFLELECTRFYGKTHFVHELLFYGYDDQQRIFKCYGYINRKYQKIDLSYNEVNRGFLNSVKYIELTDGWEEYMLITMQKVGHKGIYPYSNDEFIEKLENYIQGDLSEKANYENLLYYNESTNTVKAMGINVTDIFVKYLDMLAHNLSYAEFESQLPAFNVYKYYHERINERLKYFAEINNYRKYLNKFLSAYNQDVVERCGTIRLLYLKCLELIRQRLSVAKVLTHMSTIFEQIKGSEQEILSGYLDTVKQIDRVVHTEK